MVKTVVVAAIAAVIVLTVFRKIKIFVEQTAVAVQVLHPAIHIEKQKIIINSTIQSLLLSKDKTKFLKTLL